MKPTTRVAASVIALMALVACSSGASLKPAARSSTYGPGAVRSYYEVNISHEISGDTNYSLDTQDILDVYEIHGTSVPIAVWTLTASTGSFKVTADDGAFLLWSADLTPGQYDGPGTYEINGKDAPVGAPDSSIRSAAYMQIARPIVDDDSVTRYDVLVEPCTLTVAKDAESGKLVCPKLGLDRDPSRTISWTWTWERLREAEPFDESLNPDRTSSPE